MQVFLSTFYFNNFIQLEYLSFFFWIKYKLYIHNKFENFFNSLITNSCLGGEDRYGGGGRYGKGLGMGWNRGWDGMGGRDGKDMMGGMGWEV